MGKEEADDDDEEDDDDQDDEDDDEGDEEDEEADSSLPSTLSQAGRTFALLSPLTSNTCMVSARLNSRGGVGKP